MYVVRIKCVPLLSVMKQILISLICLLALGEAQAQTDAKAARIKLIRSAYAQAKDKVAQNGKNGQSPKDMVVVTNDVTDDKGNDFFKTLKPWCPAKR